LGFWDFGISGFRELETTGFRDYEILVVKYF